MKDKYKAYVETFDIGLYEIQFRYEHSLRVEKICLEIADYYQLNKSLKEILEVVGLLHDYSRFKQWHLYKTFSDHDSFNHADEAVKDLFEKGDIKNFYSKEENYDVIKNAIYYHNKLSVPKELDYNTRLVSNIIRDADKLDIFYLYTLNKDFIKTDKSPINEELKKDFKKHTLLDRKKALSDNDYILTELAYVFDINYKYSYEKLKKENYINKIYEEMDNKEIFKPFIDEINEYIEMRVNENDR